MEDLKVLGEQLRHDTLERLLVMLQQQLQQRCQDIGDVRPCGDASRRDSVVGRIWPMIPKNLCVLWMVVLKGSSLCL